MSKVEVNTVEPQCGTTLTLGGSGDTVALGSGASQTGFGRTGTVDWDTASIKTTGFTAVSGNGYFCNTTGGIFTATLPSSPSAGDIVALKDYAGTFATNTLTLGRGGSNINGTASDFTLTTNGVAITVVYVDGTKGWLVTDEGSNTYITQFINASGGTISTCGNDRIHTFTGPGCFTVTALGNPLGSDTVGYAVVAAGGGGGGGNCGGGGGAGGYREAKGINTCYTASPLVAPAGLSVTAGPTVYPIVVGGGGAASTGAGPGCCTSTPGGDGNVSSFSTISSAGGGGGAGGPVTAGRDGGSGGGSGGGVGGTGNTPPVSPAQGFDGGGPGIAGGGGGGALASFCCQPYVGGPGANTTINPAEGTSGPGCGTYFSGGGGGGKNGPTAIPAPTQAPPAPSGFNGARGGYGGGGRGDGGASPGTTAGFACAGTDNTGGGGGGGGRQTNVVNYNGKAGGSGIVIIRYKFQ